MPSEEDEEQSEADEVLGRKTFPLAVTLSNQSSKAIGIYASQAIGQTMILGAIWRGITMINAGN